MATKEDVSCKPQQKLFLGDVELTYASTRGDVVKDGEIWIHHVYKIQIKKD